MYQTWIEEARTMTMHEATHDDDPRFDDAPVRRRSP